MKKHSILFIVYFLAVITSYGQTTTEFFNQTDAFLAKHVKDGRVDYKTIKSDSGELDGLIKMTEVIRVSKENEKEYQAFWINAFNLHVINSIQKLYPMETILKDNKAIFETHFKIGGEEIYLNDVENKMLRESFPNEPRFHFVLVNGALNSPPIINSAYRPETLDAQMNKQTGLAINNNDYIKVSRKSLELPMMFDWYKEDFTRDGKNLKDFVKKYSVKKLPKKAKISFYSYDFSLNDIE